MRRAKGDRFYLKFSGNGAKHIGPTVLNNSGLPNCCIKHQIKCQFKAFAVA